MFLPPDPAISPVTTVALANGQLHDRWLAAYNACYGTHGAYHMAAVDHELRAWEAWAFFCEEHGLPDPGMQIGDPEPVGK